ncbi:F-box protein [Apostasia shenzhenica]|uniref:F-box protein n=1 Tax=Apostasia shenzhenica TaxID=1088818 RepID=A0A2H9ZUT8_9ASPA|nr:F-box protein [Apostasia shenzhenica]
MPVLRSGGSIPDTPPIVNPSRTASSSPSSSVATPPSRRSLRLASMSSTPEVTIATDDSAATRKRSARVSDRGCSSNVMEGSRLHFRSGKRLSRRRLSVDSDPVEKEEEKMWEPRISHEDETEAMIEQDKETFSFNESGTGRKPTSTDGLVRYAVRHIEVKEGKKKIELDLSVQEENGYMSLRSGSRVPKRKIGGEPAVFRKENFFPAGERIEISGDQMFANLERSISESSDSRIPEEEKKGKGKLVFEENQLGKGMPEIHSSIGLNCVSEKGEHFSNGEELVESSVARIYRQDDTGTCNLDVKKGSLAFMSGIYLNFDPISEKEPYEEMHSAEGLNHLRRSRRYSRENKGKKKLSPEEFHMSDEIQISAREPELGNANLSGKQMTGNSQVETRKGKSRRDADKNRAIELAPQFAFFKAEEEASEEEASEEEAPADDSLTDPYEEEDWPGPFSTAMKIIEEREAMLRERELNYSKKDGISEVKIPWTPSIKQKPVTLEKSAPSLKDLCMDVLCDNAEEIESLEGLPDAIKSKLAMLLCRLRRMSSRVLGLLTKGSPADVYLSDCSWTTETVFEEVFSQCNTGNLKALQLDFCGRCLPDYVLHSTLAKSPNCLPSLNRLSLKGAYCLSDGGLSMIVASAPLLRSLNVSQCSLLTYRGIIAVADKLEEVLRELYIDDCQNVDAMSIIPALLKMKYLEVLSVSHIETVSDRFLKKLIPNSGPKITQLNLAGCRKVTNASMKMIADNCPHLSCLDIRDLNRLNDFAIQHLVNGCSPFQRLKLCRSAFSDEVMAALIEASGATLVELVINNLGKVAGNTALAISRRCSLTLRSLDLSFCRKMTDEALGLIVNSCSRLQILKLFGCTQVTDVFLEGHSNSLVKIIGLKGSILEQVQANVSKAAWALTERSKRNVGLAHLAAHPINHNVNFSTFKVI